MTADWKQRIVVDPDILVGKPVIKGTRISVELILDQTAAGWSLEDILESYPHLKREDVLAAHSFAAALFKEVRHAHMTSAEIEAFFRRFKVDTSSFKFDRDEANAR